MIVERFLKQRILGYSADFRRTHWRHKVKFVVGGGSGTMYSTDTRDVDGYIWSGQLTEYRPFVAVSSEEVERRLSAVTP